MTDPSSSDRRIPETLALTGVTVAVVLGFARVFDSSGFLPPLLFTAVVAHVMAAITRNIRRPWAGPIMLVTGALVTIGSTSWSATTWGIPTRSTIHVLGHELHLAWQAMSIVVTPTSPTAGFLFTAAVALWLTSWCGDRLAFRFAAPIEALAPVTTVFMFCTLLAGPRHRYWTAGIFGATVLLFVLVERTRRQALRTSVLHAGADDGGRRTISMGTAMTVSALAIGITSVVVVPSLQSGGLVEVRSHRPDDAPRSVVSPLVDIRARLIEQRDDEMFRVTASRPAYWRLMSLDSFDGTIWSSNQHFRSAGSRLRSGGDTTTGSPRTTPLSATFDLTGLGGPWAPAPFRAVGVTGTDQLLWDPDGATLIVRAARGDVGDLHYRVDAESPTVTKSSANAATGEIPRDVARTDLALPADFPDDLTALAHQIVDTAKTPYDKAMALQNYFRDNDHFRYSTVVGSGQDVDAMRSFLQRGAGYCEQFAGTYAALARAVGLPTRVAVGFTSGTATGNRTYTVFGRNAHAWPEVYLAGLGWLPFEPTPGRGNPDARSYTGVVPQQASPGNGPPETLVPPTTSPATTAPTSVPATTSPQAPPPTLAPTTPPSGASGSQQDGLPGWVLPAIGAILAAVMLLGTGPALRRRRRVRRRTADPSPAGQVRAAWAEALEAWAPDHLHRHRTDTDLDMGRRLADHLMTKVPEPGLPETAIRLAQIASTATWQAADIDAATADEANRAAEQLCQAAIGSRSAMARLRIWLDPRPASTADERRWLAQSS